MSAIVTQAAPTGTAPVTQNYTKSGLGTPLGAITIGSNVTSIGTGVANAMLSIGATDFTNQGSISSNDEDAQNPSDSARHHRSDSLVDLKQAGTGTTTEEADENGTVTDGAQLNWTTTGSARYVSALLLKEGISNVDFQTHTLQTGAATITTGFQPDVLIFFTAGLGSEFSAGDCRMLVTLYERSADSYVCAGMTSQDSRDLTAADSQSACGISTTSGFSDINAIGTLSDDFTVGTFTATGFDITRVSGSSNRLLGILALKLDSGYNAKVGVVNAPTSPGVTDLITGLTGTPILNMFIGTLQTTVTSGVTAAFGIGAATETDECSACSWAEDAATGSSNCGQEHNNDSCLVITDDVGTIVSEASLSGFSSGKSSLNFSTAANGVEIGYLTIQQEAAATTAASRFHHEGTQQ